VVVEHPVLVAKRAYNREWMKRWAEANPDRDRSKETASKKKWNKKNHDRVLAMRRDWAKKNPEKVSSHHKAWSKKNRSHINAKSKQRRQADPEGFRAGRRSYYAKNRDRIVSYQVERVRSNPLVRLAMNLRNRLKLAVKTNQKTGSAVRDLGCTVALFKAKLESQWQAGWSWENYGTVWVIDHYFPLAWADLEDRTETLAACNHRNLRALSKEENEQKGDTVCAQAQYLFNTLKKELGAAA
jgi:hypothetical protein